jgi:hypothetical protein
LRDLRFDQRNLRRSRLVLGFSLRHVHLRYLSVLELQLEQVSRFLVGLQGPLRHHQLLIQCAQLYIAAGGQGHHREDHAAARFFRGQHVGVGALRLAPVATPQVNFPAGREQGLVGRTRVWVVWQLLREFRLDGALALAACAVAHQWKQPLNSIALITYMLMGNDSL